jgi:hypothetical protein
MPQRSARARPCSCLGRATLFHGVEDGGVLSVRLGTACSLPPWPQPRAAATSRTHVGSLVADVAVGYRPADGLSRRRGGREEAVGLRGREVKVDGAALLLPLVGRAGARDVGLQVDALAAERVDPFVGLVRVDEVDDGFACDVEPRLERRPTRRPAPRTRRPSPPTPSARGSGRWRLAHACAE